MKKRLLLSFFSVIVLAIALQGCSNDNKPLDIWTNDKIDSELRKQVGLLNDKLFKAIMAGNIAEVKTMLSDQLIAKGGGKVDSLVSSASQSFGAKNYKIVDEFYTKHPVKNEPDTLATNTGNDTDYKITYRAMNEEMYTSVLLSQNLSINCMVLVVYGKYGNDWKVNILQIGEFSIDGKTSQDFYKIAQKYYDEGDLLDAANMMVLTSQLASPAEEFFLYKNEDTLKDYYFKVIDDVNKLYSFPYRVKEVSTIPQIFEITPEFVADEQTKGIYPLIKYRSAIKLKDVAALKAENASLQAVIGDLFPGVLKNNKFILYKAYNSTPDGKVPGDHYNFVQKTTK